MPLIGFAGAPFTLASYVIEGGHSRDYARTKTLMLAAPAVFERLMDLLADTVVAHLLAQIEAGAQVFSSSTRGPARWARATTRASWRRTQEGVRRRRAAAACR